MTDKDFYRGDVGVRQRSTIRDVFTYRGGIASKPEERKCHDKMNITGKIRECRDCAEQPETTPIGVIIDVTRSRGDDAKVIYGKMPMFFGQLVLKNYLAYPEICVAAVGDATCDLAPIQVGQFESDNRIDEDLQRLWLEEGGGGTGQESYELMAYYFARKTVLDANLRGKKGYIFFLGDEGFYPMVKREEVKTWLGDDIPEDIPSEKIFAELQKKYHVYFVYPQKTWEERRSDIDAEIEKRVKQAGGMYDNVDIRFSLMWNNRNDLDIHVVDPLGYHIFFGSYCKSNGKGPAPSGGFLDVDMNVSGETTKPVENIRWERGKAPKGTYRVFVRNYSFHEQQRSATPFEVEIEIAGKITHFKGETPKGLTGSDSDIQVGEFYFDPDSMKDVPLKDRYEAYDDQKIKEQWTNVISPKNVLIIEDPNGIVDVIIGAIALNEETRSLEEYLKDMADRNQTPLRIEQTARALQPHDTKSLIACSELPNKKGAVKRKTSRRL